MAAGARPMNMCIVFTNRKSPSIHSESVPRSRSKASKQHTATPIKKKRTAQADMSRKLFADTSNLSVTERDLLMEPK